jgi:restriction system-associated AAA family ATPase
MKLIRIKINSSFRSLQAGFEMNFHNDDVLSNYAEDLSVFHPFCFTGLNGSGKSNVLELLASIFFHLDSCVLNYKPVEFEKNFSAKICHPDSFEIEYFIGEVNQKYYSINNFKKIKIIKVKQEAPRMFALPYPFTDSNAYTEIPLITNHNINYQAKNYLPDLIVAYSSGENEILSLPFIKSKLLHYDEYTEAVKANYKYETPESSLIYVDSSMSQAVLLSNLLFQSKEALAPLKEELGIISMRSFRINLNIHLIKKEEKEVSILEQLEDKIKKLKLCATSWHERSNKSGVNTLVLDYSVNESTKKAFQYHFDDAFDLFRLFQVLYFLNNRTLSNNLKEEVYKSSGYYTDGKFQYPAPADQVFYFLNFLIEKQNRNEEKTSSLLLRNFSDGEHQFLHTMGICLMLKHHRTLLLLDEPETHFNPDWRSKFIKLLQDSIKVAGRNSMLQEVIMTSHSPFIISDCLPDKVVHFDKNEGIVFTASAKRLNLNTYGTSIDIILDVLFGKSQTIGELSLSELKFDLSTVKNLSDVTNIKRKIAHLGSSLEKDMLLASLNTLKF